VRDHGLNPCLYAADTQIYSCCLPGATTELQGHVSACVNDVTAWMRSNRLQLNTDKTEVIWCSSPRRQHQIPTVPFTVGTDIVNPVSSVRDLGIYIDSDLSMRTHVSKTVSACFAALRQIRSIRRSVSRPVLQSLVSALVLTRLDYGCSMLVGITENQLNRLQSVLNAAARLIYSARKFDHVSPLLRELHWLRIPQCIEFHLAVLAFRCLHGTAPQYLASDLLPVADNESRKRLRSDSMAQLHPPNSQSENYRRPCLSNHCLQHLERLETYRHIVVDACNISEGAENRTLHPIVPRLKAGQLSDVRTFNCVTSIGDLEVLGLHVAVTFISGLDWVGQVWRELGVVGRYA